MLVFNFHITADVFLLLLTPWIILKTVFSVPIKSCGGFYRAHIIITVDFVWQDVFMDQVIKYVWILSVSICTLTVQNVDRLSFISSLHSELVECIIACKMNVCCVLDRMNILTWSKVFQDSSLPTFCLKVLVERMLICISCTGGGEPLNFVWYNLYTAGPYGGGEKMQSSHDKLDTSRRLRFRTPGNRT